MSADSRRRASNRRRMHSDDLEGLAREDMMTLVEAHARRAREYYLLHQQEEGADSVLRWWQQHEAALTAIVPTQGV